MSQKLDEMSKSEVQDMLKKMADTDKGKEMLGDAKPADMTADDMRAMLKKMAQDEELASAMDGMAAKGWHCPDYRAAKALTDIPNLRGSDQQCCMNCANYQFLPSGDGANAPMVAEPNDEGACSKYECQVNGNWVCNTWTKPDVTQNPLPVMIVDSQAKAGEFAVKFLDAGETQIRGYAVLWGDPQHPDLSKQRDYFTKSTDFWADKMPLRWLAYHHGFDAATKSAPLVGNVSEYGDDEIGRWFKGQLDKAHKYYAAIKELIHRGALKTSSDSIPQYVVREPRANNTHEVKRWPMPIVSLTPVPAEPRMWSVQELKSLGLDLQLPEEPAETPPVGRADSASASQSHIVNDQPIKHDPHEVKTMSTKEELLAAYKEMREQEKAEEKLAAEVKTAEDARINELAEAKYQAKMADLAKGNRKLQFATKTGDPHVAVYSKYDGMKMEDLAFLTTLRIEGKRIGKSEGADEELRRALAVKSFQAVEKGQLEIKAMEDLEVKSNEVMQSTLASYGDEWVYTNYSSQLWMKIRDKSRLVAKIPEQEIPKGYESETIPLEGTDFTFYNVSQVANDNATTKTPDATVTSSKAGTGQRVITVGKLGARGEISGELDEDSIIDSIPEARRKLEAQLPVELEFLLLNADDTAATDNINGDGTPTSGADYTLWKGLIRLGLKTNTANQKDMGAAIDTTKIALFYVTLGTNGLYVYSDPSACLVVCDGNTWMTKIWTLSDLLTVSNAGQQYATINRGAQADGGIPILGVPWYPSAGVLKAQATGVRHSATGAEDGSDTLGRAVLVRPDQWKMRWKRRAKFETTRIARADVTEIVVTMRFGVGYYDTDAASVAFNI